MNAIDAAQANHLSDIFWTENKNLNYNEKIMHAIECSARTGKRFVQWGFILSKSTKEWLNSLGYRVEEIKVDYDKEIYQYFIRWGRK